MTRTYRTTTFTDCEAQTFVASNRRDEFHVDGYVVTRHYHFYTFGESDFARYVKRTDVELRTIVVVERSVTTTFFFLQDINLSLEFRVGFYLSRVADYHTTFDFILVDTTEQQTYVITSFTFVENLRNISTPVTTDFLSAPKPRICTSSPTLRDRLRYDP